MRIRNIELVGEQWTIDKYATDDGEWVRLCEIGTASKGEDRVVWEGPVHSWLEMRVLFNELHSLILSGHTALAFPAHANPKLDKDGWPI